MRLHSEPASFDVIVIGSDGRDAGRRSARRAIIHGHSGASGVPALCPGYGNYLRSYGQYDFLRLPTL
jgi:hypothetical protein